MLRGRRQAFAFAAASTICGGVLFGVVGHPERFPLHYVGFALFLAGVFGLALYLYGKVD